MPPKKNILDALKAREMGNSTLLAQIYPSAYRSEDTVATSLAELTTISAPKATVRKTIGSIGGGSK